MAKTKKHLFSVLQLSAIFFLGIIVIILSGYLTFILIYKNKIYPGVAVGGIGFGGKTLSQASPILADQFQKRQINPIYFNYDQSDMKIDLHKAQPQIDETTVLDQAYKIGRTGNLFEDLKQQITALVQGYSIQPNLIYNNTAALNDQFNQIDGIVSTPPQNAKIQLGSPIIVTAAQDGLKLNSSKLNTEINNYLTLNQNIPTILPVQTVSPAFTNQDAQVDKVALEMVGKNPLKIAYADSSIAIDQATLFSLLDFSPTSPINDGLPQVPSTYGNGARIIDPVKLANFLSKLSDKINQPAQNPRFFLDPNTNKVSDFQESQVGKTVNINQTAQLIDQSLRTGSTTDITLAVDITQPKVSENTNITKLGVSDLLGQGLSYFHGSINNRIYNLTLAAQRINGVLIAPGEEFSFDKAVGDISQATGFKPGYSIKDGKTVLDDGGGVCQISTTVFRAALNAGLPITDRTAHAYRVHYYEEGGFPPGLDATIYSPYVDLKFKNDTPAYILVQSYVKDETVYVNLFGTKDGRVVSMTKPKILTQTPPPPDVHQDDPTLPKGTVKQVEFAAWGANVAFDRTVTRNGQTLIQETWKSNFQPWAAVYLVGTKEN